MSLFLISRLLIKAKTLSKCINNTRIISRIPQRSYDIKHVSAIDHMYKNSNKPTFGPDDNDDTPIEILRKRLKARCKSRGIKELDIIFGNWADIYVDTLDRNELNELTDILNEETPNLKQYFMKNVDIPDRINNSVMESLIKFRNNGGISI